MTLSSRAAVIAMTAYVYSSAIFPQESNNMATYRDSSIQFKYPKNRYKKIEVSSEANLNYDFRTYDLIRQNADDADTITICNNSLDHCADSRNKTRPYWLDADTHELILFSNCSIPSINISS